jgi:thioredoxin
MSTSRATIPDVTGETFAAEVERSAVPVLVEIWAPWCAPCAAVERVLEGVAEEYAGQAKVVRVNIDESPDLAVRFGVEGIPTVLLFSRGVVREHAMGLRPREEYARFVLRALAARRPTPRPVVRVE